MLPRIVTACAAGAALAGSLALPAGAVTTTARPPLAVTVGPVRQHVTARPGGSVPVTFTLGNIGSGTVVVTAASSAFGQTPAGTMTPAPVPPSQAGWLRLPSGRFTIAPNTTVTVSGQVDVPGNATPGDADLAAAFTARLPGTTSSGASASTVPVALAELVVSVPGKVTQGLAWSLTGGGWSWGGAVPLRATVTEQGNAYAVLNSLRLGGAAHVRLPGVLLLAHGTRTLPAAWSPPAWCLPCRVTFGSANATVWRVPWLPVLGALLIAAALTGLGLYDRRSRARARARRHGKPGLSLLTARGTHHR